MRTGLCAMAVAAVMAWSAGAARADVEGQVFDIDVTSTVSGNFSGVLSFLALGNWTLDVDGSSEGGSGDYTQSGTFLTIVSATGDNGDQYVGTFVGVAIDPKQVPGPLGAIARRNNTPATISGRGVGNLGDAFRFSGTEILP